MVRKQLYLEEYQNKALKQRAKELNISEAELMRRALDDALTDNLHKRPISKKVEILQKLFAVADRMVEEHPIDTAYKFNRQELYEEDRRFSRWS